MACASLGEALLHFGMAEKVVLKAGCYVLALRDDGDSCGDVEHDFVEQQGVVCATEDDGVDEWVFRHEFVDAVLHEIIGTWFVKFAVFNERNPHRTSESCDAETRVKFLDFELVAFALDGAFRGENADVVIARNVAHDFCGWDDDSEDSTVGGVLRKIVLLDGAQCLGGGCVASEDDEGTTHLEEFFHGLEREFIDYVERTCAVRGTGIVAQIDVVVLGKLFADGVKDGQSAVA